MSRNRRPTDEPFEVNLPITSFLDMAFQLLFFFVVIFKPHNLEVTLDLALPASGEARAQAETQVDPTKLSDTELDLKSDVTITITTQKDDLSSGGISSITVQGLDGNPKTFSDKDFEQFRAYIQNLQRDVQNKDNIRISADGGLLYSFVAQVMDACRKAGYKNIGFAAPPDFSINP